MKYVTDQTVWAVRLHRIIPTKAVIRQGELCGIHRNPFYLVFVPSIKTPFKPKIPVTIKLAEADLSEYFIKALFRSVKTKIKKWF